MPLAGYSNGTLPAGEGNNITLSPCWFRYQNYQFSRPTSGDRAYSSPGIPSVDCGVNIVIKSQYGIVDKTPTSSHGSGASHTNAASKSLPFHRPL